MPVALDKLGNAGNLHRCRKTIRIQRGQNLVQACAVFDNQGALRTALCGPPKHIQRRAAQTLEPREDFEGRQHGRAELLLLQLALFIAPGQQRWRQVVVELEIAFEHAVDPLQERSIGMQARHFVLVLVGHELEQVARYGLGQQGLAKRRLALAHLVHKHLVLLRIGGILVGGQELDAPLDQVIQRLAFPELQHLRRRQKFLHTGPVVGRAAAPFERSLVVVHRHRV